MDGSTVALTGGSGFLGSHVAESLLEAGYRVRALVRRPEAKGWLEGLDVELVRGDVREAESLAPLVSGVDSVVHVAGKTSARSLDEYLAVNAGGTRNVVAAVQRHALGAHLVHVSSQAAAGPCVGGRPVSSTDSPKPVSSYGRSKLEGENAVREISGLSFTILRPSAIYGPRETAIRDLFVAASRGFVPVLAGGVPKVQMVYVKDVARAIPMILARGGRGETFFAAHPEVLTYRDVAETIAALQTRRPWLVGIPAPLIRTAGVVVGLVSSLGKGPPVFNAEKAEEMLQPAWLCDVEPTQVALGRPFTTSFAEGARLTNAWYRERGWIRSR